ncbi:Lhr family helicase [Mobilicoccus pelagius]|nr:DEAD/DEAH box helicase [Mobilicoccus pelagius]
MNETPHSPESDEAPEVDAPVVDVLTRFSPATREWFTASFREPTAAQAGAWHSISGGDHTLVVAPTGSGKTLSAFLFALDRLASSPPPEPQKRCRVLYVSPLKALAVDVERNLRSPLVGIGHAARRLGLPEPDVTVAVRSGDTPADERRAFARRPTDILITTPESLFLLLTSKARESLVGVETVIIDEIHALAGTKRGAHLAVSLDRLDALLPSPAQRIGLSATVRPLEEVARYLAGGRPVTTVAPPSRKQWDLQVVVPVEDMGALGQVTGDLSGAAAGAEQRTSIWPHVEQRLVDLIDAQHSTLVFANSRRLSERLTTRLNEIHEERLEAAATEGLAAQAEEQAAAFFSRPEAVDADDADDLDEPGDLAEDEGAGSSGGGARHRADGDTGEGLHTDSDGDAFDEDHPDDPVPLSRAIADLRRRPPAQIMAQAGASRSSDPDVPVLARAHHGSVSREQRSEIEGALKAGRLPAVVATSSLELGIDMGAIDLVVQVESPPSVAGGLQRVGRAGHQVGAVSTGVFFPKYRGDLVQTTVVVERMRQGAIEALRIPTNPLDVLAQQVVAMCALDAWSVDDALALFRRSAPFADLSPTVFESVLDMLAGRYPSEEFAELRPRIVWDRLTGTLTGRPGAQRLAVTSGGTIPDRGLFGVFLAGDGPGRRVGELDEEMVYESRVGDVFTLGTSSWRIEDITHDRVLVSPAPGQPGKLPFWKGDTLGRPLELGRAVGAFVREISAMPAEAAHERARSAGLDEWAANNLLAYLREQAEATSVVPSDRTIVLERFRDEIGDWQIAIHSPFGSQVHAPWALAISARMRERFGVDVQAMHGDDGIVLRLPDLEFEADAAGVLAEIGDLVTLDPDEVTDLVTNQVGGSALFASRFRECAGRALLLPRRDPGRRQALWQQRQRAAQLLEVASRYPEFPIVLEAVRECLQDVFDVPGLVELMRAVGSRSVSLVSIDTEHPSPFARSLLFGYVAQFLYEGDSPLAERRAAALALDPTLLAELLGRGEGASLRDLLDPAIVEATERELQYLDPERMCRHAEDVADMVRRIGPLTDAEITARTREDARAEVPAFLTTLTDARRLVEVRIAGVPHRAAVEDAGRLRDALGVAVPPGVPDVFLEPLPDPLGDLVSRYARCHGPFSAADLASRLGLGTAVVRDALRRLVSAGRIVEGELRPAGSGIDHCDAEILRRLRRRSLAALRAEVEPASPRDFARFTAAWQGVTDDVGDPHPTLRGPAGFLRAVEQLSGARVPASALESLVLPSRVVGYTPAMLDEALTRGDVLWQGHGTIAGDDGWVSLHLADTAPLTLAAPTDDATPDGVAAGPEASLDARVLDLLGSGGGYFFPGLLDALHADATATGDDAVLDALWRLVWGGRLSNDTFAPVRALLAGGHGAHKSRRRPGPARLGRRGIGALGSRSVATPHRTTPPRGVGRWTLLPAVEPDATARTLATAEVLLDRYGVLTRGSVEAEGVEGAFSAMYKVLSAAEDTGAVRRGYFVEHLGAAQFASAGAVDRLRASARGVGEDSRDGSGRAVLLAATDPANPYGAALPWPDRGEAGHRPGRKAGGLVVLVDGALACFLERGGRTVLTFPRDTEGEAASPAAGPGAEAAPASWSEDGLADGQAWVLAGEALADAVRRGALERLTVVTIDAEQALGSTHPLAHALLDAGFHTSPQGLRIRRS